MYGNSLFRIVLPPLYTWLFELIHIYSVVFY
jgi:hypothetical protein